MASPLGRGVWLRQDLDPPLQCGVFRARPLLCLPPEPLEAVRELGTFVTLVRELCDKHRERLRVPGDPQGSGIDGIEPHIADQLSGDLFAARIVPAVDEAGFPGLAPAAKTPNNTSLGTVLKAQNIA